MNKLKILILLTFLVFSSQSKLIGCTTFCLSNTEQFVLCKNLDWDFGLGHIEVNKKGLHKKAFASNNETPIEWISKYGSITFNHIGKEFPLGGMNEAGLVVEEMNYYYSKYPKADNRPVINELQWIQYQLDNHSTVEEVINSDSTVRIKNNLFKIHYLVCDKKGNVATIEFLNGKMVYHTKNSLPFRVLTNHKYEKSIEIIKNYIGFGGEEKIPQEYGSLSNFIRASSMIQNYNKNTPVLDYSFKILSSVSCDDTQWSIAYDVTNLRIYYKTKNNKSLKWIDLEMFNFSCNSPAKHINVNTKNLGNLYNSFKNFDINKNKRLVDSIYKIYSRNNLLNSEFNERFFIKIANYPSLLNCDKTE